MSVAVPPPPEPQQRVDLPPPQRPLVVPSGPFAQLGATVRTLAENPLPYFLATAIVVVPVRLLLIWAFSANDVEGTLLLVLAMVGDLIGVPALVTAFHCTLTHDLVSGRPARLGRALRVAAPHVVPLFVVVALYLLAVGAGLLFFVVPGIWLAVWLYFGVQAVVLEDRFAFEALRRSAALVTGRWWSTAGRLLLGFVVTFAAGISAGISTSTLGLPLVPHVAVSLTVQCILISATALYTTLLFLSLRDSYEPLRDDTPVV